MRGARPPRGLFDRDASTNDGSVQPASAPTCLVARSQHAVGSTPTARAQDAERDRRRDVGAGVRGRWRLLRLRAQRSRAQRRDHGRDGPRRGIGADLGARGRLVPSRPTRAALTRTYAHEPRRSHHGALPAVRLRDRTARAARHRFRRADLDERRPSASVADSRGPRDSRVGMSPDAAVGPGIGGRTRRDARTSRSNPSNLATACSSTPTV